MAGLTTAPIDSFESIFRSPASDPNRMAIVTTALAHGVPVIELGAFSGEDGRLLEAKLDDLALNEALDGGFEAFCLYAAARWKDMKRLTSQLLTIMVKFKPENSHPLIRLMRNHWFWLWYEMLLTARAVRDPNAAQLRVTYWHEPPLLIGARLAFSPDNSQGILLGPLVIMEKSGEGDVEAALAGFQGAIINGWSSVQGIHRPKTLQQRSGGKYQLYTSAQLARLAAARDRVSWKDLDTAASQILSHLDQIKSVSCDRLSLGPYRSVFHVGAAITAFDHREQSGVAAHDHHLTLETVSDHPCCHLEMTKVNVSLSYRGIPKQQTEIDEISRRQGAKISSAWRAYIRDCNTILLTWLSHSLWERVTYPESIGTWGVFGERLTRFIANSFLANECNIYQVDYSQSGLGLDKIGGYSDDADGLRKSIMMRDFMAAIQPAERTHSISYRAMSHNTLQYVNFEDPDTPPGQRRLSFPSEGPWNLRGRSAVALPISVNGNVWGVMELISFNYDHFPFNVRVQLGEVVDTIGTALSFQSMSEMLNQIDRIVADNDLDISSKRDKVVASLPRYFMSSDVSLVRFRAGPSGNIEYSIAALTGHHAAFSPAEDITRHLSANFDQMVRQGTPVMTGILAEDMTLKSDTERFDTVIALLPFTEGETPGGAVVMRMVLPIKPEAGWHQPLQVLGQYFLNAIDTLDTEINWARHQRSRYGHELIRNINAIDDVEGRLKSLVKPQLEQTGGRRDLQILLNDLDRAKRSLALYAEALTDSTLTSNSFDDPRLVAMKRHLHKRSTHTKIPIDVRDTFHAAIYSRRAEARDAKIQFLPFPSFDYPKVRIDDVLLYDVVSTLVDNSIKYALPNTSVSLRPRVSERFQVAMSNLGPDLDENEERKIFQDRFRGRYAEMYLPESGYGLGLGYAQSLMEIVGGDLTYQQKQPDKRGQIEQFDVTWHHFTITFPQRTFKNAS